MLYVLQSQDKHVCNVVSKKKTYSYQFKFTLHNIQSHLMLFHKPYETNQKYWLNHK